MFGTIKKADPVSAKKESEPLAHRAVSHPKTQVNVTESTYGGQTTVLGFIGALAGVFVGFLMRPAAPLIGQLPLDVVITRGSSLRGMDQLLVSYAETSFNYALVGLIIGGVGGAVVGYALSKKPNAVPASPKEIQPTTTKSVELGQSPEQVESILGQPEKKVNLGSKVVYVYRDMKIIFLDNKVSDVQ